MKTLIFEGAGWDGAENNGVGNCRIRTRIQNKAGQIIYLELTGHQTTKNSHPAAKKFTFAAFIDSCFYDDAKWDARRNHSSELSHLEHKILEYTKESILSFVNENLNCSFTSLEVVNEGLRVHSTEDPLCSCIEGSPVPYKDIEINISVLAGVPVLSPKHVTYYADYKLSWETVKNLPHVKEWIDDRSAGEIDRFPHLDYYARLRWDESGIITSLEVSSRQSHFAHFALGAEILESVIHAILKDNKQRTLKAV